MARILPEHGVKGLIGSALIGADERYLNPNGPGGVGVMTAIEDGKWRCALGGNRCEAAS